MRCSGTPVRQQLEKELSIPRRARSCIVPSKDAEAKAEAVTRVTRFHIRLMEVEAALKSIASASLVRVTKRRAMGRHGTH